MFALLSLLTVAPPAVAQTHDVATAEYQRLHGEMRRLSQRRAWSGLERAYVGASQTGIALSFEDHLHGATAANELGNVDETRKRLWKAHQLREDRQVIEWLWTIDTGYGQVELAVDQGREGLIIDDPPFEPVARMAIGNAQAKLDDEGTYTGLLPLGDYQLGAASFAVAGQAWRPVKVDVRSEPTRGWFKRR